MITEAEIEQYVAEHQQYMDFVANYIHDHLETIEKIASSASTAPLLFFLFIFLFMTIESSFIPFPSEVVMIPAGFLIWRYPLTGSHALDLLIVIAVGLCGSMAGAYVNYFLSKWLGRPVLHKFLKKYGKYVLLSEQSLDRAEEIFREYGEVVTFVSRLLPAIRQLISIPAGLSHMNLARFSLFTALGAGLWTAVLTLIGAWFGHAAGEKNTLMLYIDGKLWVKDNYLWVFLGCAVLLAGYIILHRKIMGSKKKKASAPEAEAEPETAPEAAAADENGPEKA